MKWEEVKEKVTECLQGDVKLTKLDFVLLAAVLVLAGMCIGLLTAPFTHGISLFSGNGCNNGNNNNGNRADGFLEEDEVEEFDE